MAKYRVALSVTITTKPIVIAAKNERALMEEVEAINLMKLLQENSDGLNIQLIGVPQRVFDTVPVTYGKEEEKPAELPPAEKEIPKGE